jgi:hypothetical protein
MYYTDLEKGQEFFTCIGKDKLLPPLPASSLDPPAKNIAFEEYGKGRIGRFGHTLPVNNIYEYFVPKCFVI